MTTYKETNKFEQTYEAIAKFLRSTWKPRYIVYFGICAFGIANIMNEPVPKYQTQEYIFGTELGTRKAAWGTFLFFQFCLIEYQIWHGHISALANRLWIALIAIVLMSGILMSVAWVVDASKDAVRFKSMLDTHLDVMRARKNFELNPESINDFWDQQTCKYYMGSINPDFMLTKSLDECVTKLRDKRDK